MGKSNLTKAKEISFETKQRVLDRQGNRSISGLYLADWNTDFHHVIYRSAEGIGAEWNIVALTKEEHRWVHDHQPIQVNGKQRYSWDEFNILMKNHLKLNYDGWSEEKCKFKKGKSFDEYGVERKRVWK